MGTQKKKINKMFKNLLVRSLPAVLLALILGSILNPVCAKASWVERDQSSIYGGGGSGASVGQGVGSLNEDDNAEEGEIDEGSGFFVDLINTVLCWLLSSIGRALFSLLDSMGASLDQLIYGRILSDSALFTFDLGKGNVYGIVSAAIFNIIRSVVILGLMTVFMVKIASAAWKRGEFVRSGLKEALSLLVLSLMLLAFMPNLLDLALYIRDIILYTIGTQGATSLFGSKSTTSIVAVLAEAANENIISGIVYIAAVLLNLYFLLGYVGVALTMTTDFVLFPLVVLKMNFDRQALSNWVWEMISCMCVPVIDAVLIMIPSFLGIYASGLSITDAVSVSIVQLIICYLIIPARSAARGILGLRANPLESAGLSAASVLGMAAARGIGGMLRQSREAKKNAELDRERASAQEDLAQLDREEEVQAFESAQQAMALGQTDMPSARDIRKMKTGTTDGEGVPEGQDTVSPLGKEQSYASSLDAHIRGEEEDSAFPEHPGKPLQNAGEIEKGSGQDKGSLSGEEGYADMRDIQKEREALRNVEERIRAANKRKSALEEEFQEVGNSRELDQEEKESRLDALGGQIKETEQELEGLNRQRHKMRVEQERAELKMEPRTLRKELTGLAASSEEISRQREELVRQRDDMRTKQGDHAAGTARYEELGKQIDILNKQIAVKDQALGENSVRQSAIQGTLARQEAELHDRQAYNLHERVKAQNAYDQAKNRAEEIREALDGTKGGMALPEGSTKRKNLQKDLDRAKQEMTRARTRIGEISSDDRRIAARLREVSPAFGKPGPEELKESENTLKAARQAQAVRRARIQKEIAEERVQMEGSDRPEVRQACKQRIARLNSDVADCNIKSARIDQAIEGIRQQAEQQTRPGEGRAGSASFRGRGYRTSLDEAYAARRNAILERYASIDNFESPEFSDISHEKKAQLYRERAMRTRRILLGRRIGGVAGSAAGGALGVWLGAPGVGIGAMAGYHVGAETAETVTARYTEKTSSARPVDYKGKPLSVPIAADLRDNTYMGQLRTVERIQTELSGALQTEQFETAVQRELASTDMIQEEIKILFKKHGVRKENYQEKRDSLLAELYPKTVEVVEAAEKRIVESCAGREYASLSPEVKDRILKSVGKPNMEVFQDLCESVYLGNQWEPFYEDYLHDK